MKMLLSLALICSFSLYSFAQEQPKEQTPPKKKPLSMDMNDVQPAPSEDRRVEETNENSDKNKKDIDESKSEKEKKDPTLEALEEVEAAILAHKSFLNTVGGQTLVTFVNHMNTTLKDDQKFLLREKPLKQFVEVQQRLAASRNLWQEYFTAWGKEISADVNKDYKTQRELLNYMESCKNTIFYNVSLSEEIVKQYKKKNG